MTVCCKQIIAEKLSKLGSSADIDIHVKNSFGVSWTYKFIVVVCRLVAMSERDHEQLAVAVEGEVHGGVQLFDSLCQAGRLHGGERARPCVDLRTLVAASSALYETYIMRNWQYCTSNKKIVFVCG